MAWPHGLKNDKHERRLSSVLDRKALFFICISFLPSGHCGAKHIICMFRNPIISLGLIFLAPTEGRLEADDNLNPPLKCPQSTTFALFRVTMWLPGTLLTFSLFVSSSFAFLSHGSITVRWILLSSVQIVKVVFTGRTLMVVTGTLLTAGFRLHWLL